MLAIAWAGNLASQTVAPAGGGAWNAGHSAEQAVCVTPEQQAAKKSMHSNRKARHGHKRKHAK